jgi:acetyltransferase-like isoleucine patch superfamily enzyme
MIKYLKIFCKCIVVFCPWRLKRLLLISFFKYDLSELSFIGFSWIFPDSLKMERNTSIGHFNVAINLQIIHMREFSSIGRNNWITGHPIKNQSFFLHQLDREGMLTLGRHTAITKHHYIDCTNKIEFGDFSTLAGCNSQLFTHSINLEKNIQDSNPIIIGDYCMIGTNVVILGGAILPNFSVLGAKSLLNKKWEIGWTLYGGVPAKPISEINKSYKYFSRNTGIVN